MFAKEPGELELEAVVGAQQVEHRLLLRRLERLPLLEFPMQFPVHDLRTIRRFIVTDLVCTSIELTSREFFFSRVGSTWFVTAPVVSNPDLPTQEKIAGIGYRSRRFGLSPTPERERAESEGVTRNVNSIDKPVDREDKPGSH